ncbi:MAG: S9 family peptidase [Candidatus Riflebacteria bacterium]|nr:S9 family peptidase [Candidatus Riflebacteria bacterium]
MPPTTRRPCSARPPASSAACRAAHPAAPDAVRPAPRPITAGDLQKFVLVADPQVSPDGRTILFTRRHTDDRHQTVSNLWIVEAPGGEPRQFSSGGKDAMGRWSPDGRQIAFLSGRQKPKSQIFLLPVGGGEARPLTQFPEGSIGEFKWSPDGTRLAVSFRPADPDFTEEARKRREEKGLSEPPRVIEEPLFRLDGDGYFNRQRHALFLVEVATGRTCRIFDRFRDGGFAFAWSPDGAELALAANLDPDAWKKPWRSRLYRFRLADARLTAVPGQADGSRSSVAWSPDGTRLAFAGVLGRDVLWGARNQDLHVVDLATGHTRNLTGGHDLCLEAAILSDCREVEWLSPVHWSPDGRHLFAEIRRAGVTNIGRFDAATGALQDLTDVKAGQVCLGNLSRDGRTFALRLGSPTRLDEIAAGSLARRRLELATVTGFNVPLFEGLALSEPETHFVTAADGTRVQLWMMRPPAVPRSRGKAASVAGKTPRGPAVLEIHGGPHAQYGACFFHEFQVLAAQGYTVFYANPRGSKGYGEAFCEAIKGDWGRHDWTDLQAVIAFMEGRPEVDPRRMAVMGGSYGGFMTNWIIGHTDRFAAAVTDRCVSNLVSMAGTSDAPILPDTYWAGNAWDRPETLWRQSPLRLFGKVATPTLIIHSEGDLRCNVEQAEQIYSCLQVRGVPTRFVRYPASTSHGLSRGGPADLRIHRLGQILDWLGRYLRPSGRPPAPPARARRRR